MRPKLILVLIILSFGFIQINAQPKGESIDKTVAVVGANAILYSDIETQYLQFLMQGYTELSGIKCDILEELLFQKLLLNKAEIDSIEVTESQVEGEIDRRMRYFIAQIGSPEDLEKYYNKSIPEIKEDMRKIIYDQMRVDQVQRSITENVKVTPSEVKEFFRKLPKDSLPLIEAEYELAQIVVIPDISIEEKEYVRNKLKGIVERIKGGASFSGMARLYSEDKGSAKDGGETGFTGRGSWVPEFEAAAFALKKKDELSPIVETEFGYHVLQLIARRGDYVNVRHILLQPKPSEQAVMAARKKLDSVRTAIRTNDTMTFEMAARFYSDDPSKNNGGLLINSSTGTSKFTTKEIDPQLFFVVDKMKTIGEISTPVEMQTDNGGEAYRIVKLISRTEPHYPNLKDDYNRIRDYALQEKQNQAIDKWIKENTKNVYINITDEELKNCSFKYKW